MPNDRRPREKDATARAKASIEEAERHGLCQPVVGHDDNGDPNQQFRLRDVRGISSLPRDNAKPPFRVTK